MSVVLSCPSKSFLSGEYAAVEGCSSLVFAGGPRFKMTLNPYGNGYFSEIHSESPAGRWIRDHHQDFENVDIEFFDPYKGAGGFGASSAQFLFVYCWSQFLVNNLQETHGALDARNLWSSFREYSSQKGKRPSGADIIAQLVGGISSFSFESFKVDSLPWGFREYGFSVFHTGHKVATHEHLGNLESLNVQRLSEISDQVMKALVESNWKLFTNAIDDFQNELIKQDLTCGNTIELLIKFKEFPEVEAVKGCGALGADTLAVFYNKENKETVLSKALEMGLKENLNESMNHEGLDIKFIPNTSMRSELDMSGLDV